jgi:hypothetical protein
VCRMEVSGTWGAAADWFFRRMAAHRRDRRDIDYFHWSSQTWKEFWLDAISVCLARDTGYPLGDKKVLKKYKMGTNSAFRRRNACTVLKSKQLLANFPHVTRGGHLPLLT